MKKAKFVSGIIAATMIVGLLPVTALAYRLDEQPPAPVADEDVYRTYMSDLWGITGVSSSQIGDYGEGGSKALRIGGVTNLVQVKHTFRTGCDQGFQNGKLKTAFRHGLGMVSFDVKPNQTDNGILIFAVCDNNGKSVPTVVFTPEGKMYFNDRHSWNIEKDYVPSNAKSYTADEWYKIKILIDANNGRFIYYLNDQYWGQYVQERTAPFNARVNPDLDMKEMFFNYHPTWENEENYTASDTAESLSVRSCRGRWLRMCQRVK